MYGLVVSARMNGVEPQAWLTDVMARIAARPAQRLDEAALEAAIAHQACGS